MLTALVLIVNSNLGSIFSGALTGNAPAELPGTSAKDSKEQLIELLFWIRIFRADLKRESISGQINAAFLTFLFPWRSQLVGNLVLMGWCKFCLTHSPSISLPPAIYHLVREPMSYTGQMIHILIYCLLIEIIANNLNEERPCIIPAPFTKDVSRQCFPFRVGDAT